MTAQELYEFSCYVTVLERVAERAKALADDFTESNFSSLRSELFYLGKISPPDKKDTMVKAVA